MGKSILEKTNSWKPFFDAIQGALQAKDFRKKTIREILQIADPELSMWPGSMKKYLRGLLIGPGFVSGREALFTEAFGQFLRRKGSLFENAPLRVIKLFNQLSTTLFSPQKARLFQIDESLARRAMTKEEKAIKRGKAAEQRLSRRLQALVQEKRPVEMVEEEVEEVQAERPLFSSYTPLDSTTQAILEELTAPSELTFDQTSREKYEAPVRALEENVQNFQTALQNLTMQLSLPPLNRFSKLSKEAESLSHFTFEKEFLASLIEKEPDAITKELEPFFAKKEEPITALVKKAKGYDQAVNHIEDEQKKFSSQLSPFLKKKDLKSKAEILLSELSLLSFPEEFFSETKGGIEKGLDEKNELLQNLTKKIEEQFHELLVNVRELERSADFYKMFLFAARWEIVAESVPYPDLKKSIRQVRKNLLSRTEEQREALIAGSLSIKEFMDSLTSSLYESDIRLIRGELTSRSLRLKELREAVGEELIEIDRYFFLLSLSKESDRAITLEREWLSILYHKILTPFSVFKETYNPDTVHLLFRYFWQDLDRYKARKERLYKQFIQKVEPSSLIRPIKQTLDLVERQGSSLYESFLEATKEGALEKLLDWLRDNRKTLTLQLLLPLTLLSFSEQKKEITHLTEIEKRITDISLFAKRVQRIRTFEPERLDSLLEITSIFPFIEKLDAKNALSNHLQKIDHALLLLEKEVCGELGLLDKKGRLEAGSALQEILEQAQTSISTLLENLLPQLKTSDPFLRPIAEMLRKRAVSLTQMAPKPSSDQDAFFSYFHKVAVLLFSTKALQAAKNPNSFARILLIMPITQNIIQNTEKTIKEDHLFALETISRNIWNSISIDFDQQEKLHRTLQSFITACNKALTTARLTESLEKRLIKSLQEISKQLETSSSFEIPHLSFVPGDLWYLWQ